MKHLENSHLLTAGVRVQVTSGPQRNATGVIDKVHDLPVGTRYRISDPDQRKVIGWFDATQLQLAPRDLAAERTDRDQIGLALLMGRDV